MYITVQHRQPQAMGGFTDVLTNALNTFATVGTAYYTGLTEVNLAKAKAQAAALPQTTPAAAAAVAQQTAVNYMPYLLGLGALVGVVLLVKK